MKKKNIKKLVKVIAILICILFVCTSAISMVMSVDTMHLTNCHVHNCKTCMLIQLAINFTKNISYIIEYIVLINVSILISKYIVQRKLENKTGTLVQLKIRLDE